MHMFCRQLKMDEKAETTTAMLSKHPIKQEGKKLPQYLAALAGTE